MLKIKINSATVQSASTQLRLRAIVNKEVDIYLALHPTYRQYKEELQGEIFLSILKKLSDEKADNYLKAAAQKTLRQFIRNINAPTRKSNIQMYTYPRIDSDEENAGEQEDYCAPCDDALELPLPMNPHEMLERKETCTILRKMYKDSTPTMQALLKLTSTGISIRKSARQLGLSKSTAATLICKFRAEFLKLIS